MNEYNPMQKAARSFLETTVPGELLRQLCDEHGIKAEEGATYREILNKVVLKRAKQGDEDAVKLVREFHIHE